MSEPETAAGRPISSNPDQVSRPETAAGRALTREEWAYELALVIAKARFGPGLDMGGRHNPKPSEDREARYFVDAILDNVRAKTLDDVAALVARALPPDDPDPQGAPAHYWEGVKHLRKAILAAIDSLRDKA